MGIKVTNCYKGYKWLQNSNDKNGWYLYNITTNSKKCCIKCHLYRGRLRRYTISESKEKVSSSGSGSTSSGSGTTSSDSNPLLQSSDSDI